MKSALFNLLLLIGIISCTNLSEQSTKKDNTIAIEIQALHTSSLKSNYLHQLWIDDQQYRGGPEGDIIAKHGYRSPEHLTFAEKCNEHDKIVFKKMKTYLEVHGYPKHPTIYHELALNAFPIIIGHNHNFEEQLELLPYLYDGYQAGNCSLDDIVWVLGEMHESTHGGKRYEIKGDGFTTEQEFIELVDALGLDLKLNSSTTDLSRG